MVVKSERHHQWLIISCTPAVIITPYNSIICRLLYRAMHLTVQCIIWSLTILKYRKEKIPILSLVIRDGSYAFFAMLGMCRSVVSTIIVIGGFLWQIILALHIGLLVTAISRATFDATQYHQAIFPCVHHLYVS